MKVAWLCPYPFENLKNIPVSYRKKSSHPATWIVNLSRALVDNYRDLDLHIVTETQKVRSSFTTCENGITFHVIRSESAVPFLLRGWPPSLPLDVLSKFRFSQRKLIKELRNIDPDIVHAHGTEMCYGISAVNSGFPTIVSIQGIMHKLADHYPENRSFRMRIPLEKQVMHNCNYFIAKTPFAHEFIKSMNPNATVFDIENAMHPAFFSVQPDYRKHNRILFVGSLLKAKGIREALEALSRLPDITLVLIAKEGDFTIKDLRREYPDASIDWKGRQSSERIAQEMQSVDMLILPSYMDNSPNVVSEAMSAGLPVVATDVGGIPFMIEHQKSGILVPSKSVEELASAIDLLLNDTKLKRRLGAKAHVEAIKRYSPEKVAKEVLMAYENILQSIE